MKPKIPVAALAGLFIGVAVQVAQADVVPGVPLPEFPTCSDDAGTPVAYITRDEYEREVEGRRHYVVFAGALYLKDNPPSHPVIVYNPDFVGKLTAGERAFVYSHECHHLSSGDSRKTYLALQGETGHVPDMPFIERDADCAAARRARHEFYLTVNDMVAMQPMIRNATAGKYRDELRVRAIMECFAGP